MAELTVISWRDIPAQVIAKRGRETAKVVLPDRFQEAIDVAAVRAGKTETDAYLAEWRRVSRPCGEDLADEAQAEADRLVAAHDEAALDALVRTGGVA